MAKRRSYNTAHYISLPVAVACAIAALMILVIVGLKYSALGEDWLATKAFAPSGGLKRCATEQTNCLKRKTKEYNTCTAAKQVVYRKCLKKIKSTLPKKAKEAATATCELDLGRDVDACTALACEPDKVPQCATAKECIKKLYDKKGVPPLPVPKPVPVPPKKDPAPLPKPVPPADPEPTDEPPAPVPPGPTDVDTGPTHESAPVSL